MGANGLVERCEVVDREKEQAADPGDRLRASEERYRLIVENAVHVAIFTLDTELTVTDWHEGAQSAFGYSPEEILGRDSRILWTDEDRRKGAPEEEASTAAATGKADDVRWHQRKDGGRVFIEGVSTALRDGRGNLTGFLKIGLNATERRRAEEYERTLFHELQHRVRNILAMIRSVARRTAETTDTTDDYLQHFDGRLSAMARLQAMLTRRPDTRVNLRDLLLEEIEAQSATDQRFELDGPEVELPSKAAEILSLAIHELATNSIKYGVLSGNSDKIRVAWAVRRKGDQDWLDLSWTEPFLDSGRQAREGFGTELITRRVPYELRGEGDVDIGPEFVRAEMRFPIEARRSLLEP